MYGLRQRFGVALDGVDTDQEIEDLHKKVKDRLESYEDRKEETFEDNIAVGDSWGRD